MRPSNSNEVAIPTKALALGDTTPSPGDDIEVTVAGKVTRVEGDRTFFVPATANGEPLPGPSAEPEMPTEPTEDSLRALAAQEDDDMG